MHRCVLTGPCLAGHTHIGTPWDLALHTFDRFGNARATGLEGGAVDVAGPEGTQVQKASVTDRGNGCYSIAFQPDREGRWLITPRWAPALHEHGVFHDHSIPDSSASGHTGRHARPAWAVAAAAPSSQSEREPVRSGLVRHRALKAASPQRHISHQIRSHAAIFAPLNGLSVMGGNFSKP